ncbi:hypothetical protein AYO49_01110 [Verrucomicrobiaceae bacterium SCGC AG-212-N21]|nr:hypothetical protein AYO49_01110 [Verrucomicrobiaceae bacterium SCGC AG-212-N21]
MWLPWILVLAFMALAPAAQAQGLLGIGPLFESDALDQLSVTFDTEFGWDSNPGGAPSETVAPSAPVSAPLIDPATGVAVPGASAPGSSSPSEKTSTQDEGSAYWQNQISLLYPILRGRNTLSLSADYSRKWYLNAPPGVDEIADSGTFSIDFTRDVTRRLRISDRLYISHETEPNYDIGVSDNRPTGGYWFGGNEITGTYQWTRRFSTATKYTFTSYKNDDEESDESTSGVDLGNATPGVESLGIAPTLAPEPAVGDSMADRVEHTFSQQFRYAFAQQTTGTLEYRYHVAEYEEGHESENSRSHYLLVGVERDLGRRLKASLNAGVEHRIYERPLGSRTAPYAESALVYQAGKKTKLRWFQRLGMEESTIPRTPREESAPVVPIPPPVQPVALAPPAPGAPAAPAVAQPLPPAEPVQPLETDESALNDPQSQFSYRTGLSLQEQLTPRISLELSISYVHSTTLSDTSSNFLEQDEDTIDGSISLSYRLWRNVNLRAGYAYSTVLTSNALREYDRQSVFLGMSATF